MDGVAGFWTVKLPEEDGDRTRAVVDIVACLALMSTLLASCVRGSRGAPCFAVLFVVGS